MKKTIRLMGLCLLMAACIVFAACGNKEVQEGKALFVTHFGNGDIGSSSYVVSTMSAEPGAEGNTFEVTVGDYTYVHTYDPKTLAVTKTVCSANGEEVYTATYAGNSCTVVYVSGKTLSATYDANGKLTSVSDGTTSIAYTYNGDTRTDAVTKGGVTVTHTVDLTTMRRTRTAADAYTITYAYTDNDNWTETMTVSGVEIVTAYVNGVKTTVTQGDVVATYNAEGGLVSRTQNGVDLLDLFDVENTGSGYRITGYNGGEASIEIPVTINLTPVVEIADGALSDIIVTSIPSSVRRVGAGAVSTSGLNANGGVYYAGNWVVGVKAGAEAVTLDNTVVGLADGALDVDDLAITYNGTQSEWTKIIKGANWHGDGYTLNLNPGNVVDGYMAKGEYGWTSGNLVFKARGGAAANSGVARLWKVITASDATNEHEAEIGLRYDAQNIYLAIKETYDTSNSFSIDLNPNLAGSTQFTIDVTAASGNVNVTAADGLVVAKKVDGYDNGWTYTNVVELAISREKLGATNDTLGLRVTFNSGNTEIVFGDEDSVKTKPTQNGNTNIGYHVFSLANNEVNLGLTSGWLLADYGYGQATVDLGAELSRTASPVVDGTINSNEYQISYNTTSNSDKFFYIDKEGYPAGGVLAIPAGQDYLDVKLAHDKNYIYAALTAKGVHDVDNFIFRIGNTDDTGYAWSVTVNANGDVKVVKTDIVSGKQTVSDTYNSDILVVGKAVKVSGDTISLEIAFERAVLERDADNPDLDRIYLQVARTMQTGGSDYGEIHFGFKVNYNDVIKDYHNCVNDRYPHVVKLTAPATPAAQTGNGEMQIGYGIANITPWLADMGIRTNTNLLNMLDADPNRNIDCSERWCFEDHTTDAVRTDGSLSLTLAGYDDGATRFSTHIEDDIYATCIAFKDGDGDIALLVSLDVLHVTTGETVEVYGNIMRALRPLGFEEGDVILTATHTHTAPNIFGTDVANRFAYLPYFYEQIYEAAEAAVNDLKTVSGISTNYHETAVQMSFERRGYNGDNTFWANDVDSVIDTSNGVFESDIVTHASGKNADSDIQMVRIDREGQTKPIVIANWSAHADNVSSVYHRRYDNGVLGDYSQPISGDFISYMRDTVSGRYDFVFLQGASGNTIYKSYVNPTSTEWDGSSSKQVDYQPYGTKLGNELLTGLNSMTVRSTADLSLNTNASSLSVYYASSHVDMPERVSDAISIVDKLSNGEISLSEAKTMLAEVNTKRKAEGLSTFSSIYECQSLRYRLSFSDDKGSAQTYNFVAITIGDVTFVSAPCELFWQTGWDIRNADGLANKTILIATHANGSYGYLPTEEVFESRKGDNPLDAGKSTEGCGGYEMAVCYYQQGSAERIEEKMVNMIKENYGIN